jgi:F420-non-reducing hydrogenase large subunit
MAQTIVIQPVSRIEGHGKVTIQLDEQGNVADTMVNVVELRGFEKFCIGRPVEEMPRITTSICGVCPWSHHLAAAKACDAVVGVEIPPAARKLRTLGNSLAYLEEHILHFFFLAGPDFVMGPGADYSVRNVFGIAAAFPEIGKRVVHSRHLASRMLEILAVKPIHPVAAVPGGFSKPLKADDVRMLKPMAQELLEFARFGIGFAKKDVFRSMDVVATLGVITTAFLDRQKNGGSARRARSPTASCG